MQTHTQVTPQWHQWIKDNLQKGCDEAALIHDMVKANFDPVVAGIAVLQALGERAATAATSAMEPLQAQNGSYVYETPRLPQTGSSIQTTDRNVRVALRVAQPVIALLDNLFSEEECDELIRLSRIKLQRSTIVDPTTGKHEVIDDRSSFGTFFTLNENPFIAKLDRRIADVMHWPIENGEGLQILNYKVGGEYKTHFDYFPPEDPGSAAHIAKGGQRVSTMVIYLNDVEQGGETIFPNVQLSVVPKKGSAVYFEYCNSLGQIDPQTLHGGTPVVAGEKWIATKWMRQQRYC